MGHVYLAPGHGRQPNGRVDPGATGGGTNEQEAGDLIAREVERILTSEYDGVTVERQPRGGPNFVGTRTEINASGADVAVELHHDWVRAPRGGFGFHQGGERQKIAEALHAAYREHDLPTRSHMATLPGTSSEPGLYRGTPGTTLLWEVDRIGESDVEHARAIAEGLAAYLGVSPRAEQPEPAPRPAPPPRKTISQMATEVLAGDHGNGHAGRRRSLGVTREVYEQVRAEVNERARGGSTPAPPPRRTVSQMAQEVLEGRHGNGHDHRRRSLGVDRATYTRVRAEVNRRAAGTSSGRTVSQMASEVIDGRHGNGHAARRRSLGVSSAVYERVRAEVNRRLSG